jgi:tripartite-type tricarboxylate transporter receptor subunit TctC
VARVITGEISGPLGQSIVVDNKPTIVAPEIVAKAPPDGYTLLILANVTWNTSLVRKVPFDPVKDLAPITMAARYPSVITVHPSLGLSSVKDLIAMAKAKPGVLNSSTGSTGGAGHLALELFKSVAGVNITRVPYSSGSQEIADLLAGRVQMTLGPGPEMAPHLKSGKMKGLAVTTAQPSALFPDLPTVAASGVPGYVFESSYNVFAPGNTPTAIINRLNQEVVRGLNKPNVKQLVFDAGAEVVTSTPAELAAVRDAELARLGKVLRDAGITAQ